MKNNTLKQLVALFGIMAVVFALFAIAPVSVQAQSYYDDCDYYGDCGDDYYDDCDYYNDCGDDYYEDDCDYYGDCGDYYDDCDYYGDCGDDYYDDCDYYNDCDDYDDYGYDSSSVNVNTDVYSENNNDIVIDLSGYYDDYEEDYPALSGYCTANVTHAEEGEIITWEAQVAGGNNYYSYQWSGSEGLTSNYPLVDMRYESSGTKTATVRITSNYETITRTCSIIIEDERDDRDHDDNDDDLDAYCVASPSNGEVGEKIKWTVYPDGGNGRYTYDWDGDDNLSGDDKSISKTYNSAGNKEAEVRVKSDGDSVIARCDVDIDNDQVYNPPSNGGIYLSSLPATGISPTLKVSLFVAGLLMWSAFLAYLYIARRNEKIRERAALDAIGQ
jgi:hypothetical protein